MISMILIYLNACLKIQGQKYKKAAQRQLSFDR